MLQDTLGRPLKDLRISVTDRCNFRCNYCMPKTVFDKNYIYLATEERLSFEEIVKTVRLFAGLGVRKIRLTGGEPLLRKKIEYLIEMIAKIQNSDGHAMEITMTTNGSLLANKAQSLKDAGLNRITVSLDALNDATFRIMNDVDFPVSDVLHGIEAAHKVGLAGENNPIKINMVVKRGINQQDILPMAQHFQKSIYSLRFIEYMDVGSTNAWNIENVVPSAEIYTLINAAHPLIALPSKAEGETATRFGYKGGNGDWDKSLGEVGFISSVTQAFCHDCNRARLSMDGKLYLCLFANKGYDLRALLRDKNSSEEKIQNEIRVIWAARDDQYSLLRAQNTNNPAREYTLNKIEMSYIGG